METMRLAVLCLCLLAASGASAARFQAQPQRPAAAAASAPGAATSNAGPLYQLDACAREHATSMVLSVSKGTCTLTTRVLGSGSGSGSNSGSDAKTPALAVAFPCVQKEAPRAQVSGPALNLWASLAPGGALGTCSVTTLDPVAYFKRAPGGPMYYGYELPSLPCQALSGAAAAAALKLEGGKSGSSGSASASGEVRARVAYGLWMVPDLRSPAQGGSGPFSDARQQCRLSVAAAGGASYLSRDKYACALSKDPEARLGAGQCFGSPLYAGGGGL